MVVIRLARGGAKKRPFYRVVAADRRKAATGKFIEKIGYYNPFATGGEKKIQLEMDRINYWKEKGAQLSDRAIVVVKEFEKSLSAEAAPEKEVKAKPAAKKKAEEKPEAKAKPASAEKKAEEKTEAKAKPAASKKTEEKSEK